MPDDPLLAHYRSCATCNVLGFYPSRLCHARLTAAWDGNRPRCLDGCTRRQCVRDYCDVGKALSRAARRSFALSDARDMLLGSLRLLRDACRPDTIGLVFDLARVAGSHLVRHRRSSRV